MAKKYLDGAGLERVWERIKAYIDTNGSSVDDIIVKDDSFTFKLNVTKSGLNSIYKIESYSGFAFVAASTDNDGNQKIRNNTDKVLYVQCIGGYNTANSAIKSITIQPGQYGDGFQNGFPFLMIWADYKSS